MVIVLDNFLVSIVFGSDRKTLWMWFLLSKWLYNNHSHGNNHSQQSNSHSQKKTFSQVDLALPLSCVAQ